MDLPTPSTALKPTYHHNITRLTRQFPGVVLLICRPSSSETFLLDTRREPLSRLEPPDC